MCAATAAAEGRESLIADMGGLLSRPGAVVSLVGDPGIGKTTVWAAALAASTADWQWRTRCMAPEADLGLTLLADLLNAAPDDVITELPGPQRHAVDVVLFREEERGEGRVGGRLLGATLLTVLHALAGRGSVLLGIDDLHWGDPTSLEAIGYAVRRIGDAAVSLATTRRAGAGQDLPHAVQIPVGPLGRDALERVVRSAMTRSVRDRVVADLVARSGGNPFFARELARQWDAEPDNRRLPTTLREVLTHRLDALDAHTREVLVDVAVRGSPTRAEVHVDDLGPALDAEIVRLSEDTLCFTHPLLANAVIADASAEQLRSAHERAAAAAGADTVGAALHRVHYEPPSEQLACDLDAAATVAQRRGDDFRSSQPCRVRARAHAGRSPAAGSTATSARARSRDRPGRTRNRARTRTPRCRRYTDYACDGHRHGYGRHGNP
jgi:hypothetical protein